MNDLPRGDDVSELRAGQRLTTNVGAFEIVRVLGRGGAKIHYAVPATGTRKKRPDWGET